MERWHNRVAVVTGASRGIGADLVQALLKAGLIVVGLARHEARMYSNVAQLPVELKRNFYPKMCDITVEHQVVQAFKWIDENLGGTDILVNCAGIFYLISMIDQNNTSFIKDTMNTNFMGAFYCTREAAASMKKRNFDGHIVNMGSYGCVKVPQFNSGFPTFSIYWASKAALYAMAGTFRQEFAKNGNKIKITMISPGAVVSELVAGIDIPILDPVNCTDAIMYALRTPPHVEVQDIIIKPLGEIL